MKTIISFLILILALSNKVLAESIVVNSGESIQSKCLNVVKPGDTCTVKNGTYNEALTMKIKGATKDSRIILRCESVKGCIVKSGSARSLVTTGEMRYYTIDGFQFISTLAADDTIDFDYDPNQADHKFWGDGHKAEKGNDGFILRNCYVEGGVFFYGSDNLVENCEFNGRGVVANGITERSEPSENNIFRNNIVHDYTVRGGWSLQMTDNTLWEGNTMYNIAPNGGGAVIDCDGAGIPVHRCIVRNNIFRNYNASTAVELENGFDSLIENNIIYEGTTGIHAINYNKENGDGFRSEVDSVALTTNTIIRNNLIYNMRGDGISCHATKGNMAANNTIYNVSGNAIDLQAYNNFPCPNWTFNNNLVAKSSKTVFLVGNPSVTINNNFYETFSANIHNDGSKSLSQWQATGKDVNSKTGDPKFTNPASGDFTLQPGSPACGMGAFPCGGTNPTVRPTTSTKIPGNTNSDTVVDLVDFANWKKEYLGIASTKTADFDNLNGVDLADFTIWKKAYLKI